ncbi:MAG: D-alanyl-D-alanine carboxypeptidase/D-alanyl-D-alanine-endopeptidase [Ginsengibacter sp.]
MKNIFICLLLIVSGTVYSQNINSVFNSAFAKFAQDADLKHATISLFVVNTTTGKPVTEINTQTGLAPASTQKIITSATAYALLGKDYTYKTTLGYTGTLTNGLLNGNIVIKGSGDPTLGSWRYDKTKEENVISYFKNAISQAGIKQITGHVITDTDLWSGEVTPDGWIWQDIGSYYGAGARALNWHENQYDLLLSSGEKINDPVTIVETIPSFIVGLPLKSMATSAAKGTGDNTYIYFPFAKEYGSVRGTIPAGESKFKISGATPHPEKQLAIALESALKNIDQEKIGSESFNLPPAEKPTYFYSYSSPTLDSISYWFLKKSINLYGEAFIKTLGYETYQSGETDKGVEAVQNFWKKQNIDPYAINIMDGSGLSPANRITTESLVQVLLYAKKQSWFPGYFDGFPVINGIKMKSGSIKDVLAYTGFISSKNNDEYAFAFIINNYYGNGNAMRKKMWKLLDELK